MFDQPWDNRSVELKVVAELEPEIWAAVSLFRTHSRHWCGRQSVENEESAAQISSSIGTKKSMVFILSIMNSRTSIGIQRRLPVLRILITSFRGSCFEDTAIPPISTILDEEGRGKSTSGSELVKTSEFRAMSSWGNCFLAPSCYNCKLTKSGGSSGNCSYTTFANLEI